MYTVFFLAKLFCSSLVIINFYSSLLSFFSIHSNIFKAIPFFSHYIIHVTKYYLIGSSLPFLYNTSDILFYVSITIHIVRICFFLFSDIFINSSILSKKSPNL